MKKKLTESDKEFIKNHSDLPIQELAEKTNTHVESIQEYLAAFNQPQVKPIINNGTVIMTADASEGRIVPDLKDDPTRIHHCKTKV